MKPRKHKFPAGCAVLCLCPACNATAQVRTRTAGAAGDLVHQRCGRCGRKLSFWLHHNRQITLHGCPANKTRAGHLPGITVPMMYWSGRLRFGQPWRPYLRLGVFTEGLITRPYGPLTRTPLRPLIEQLALMVRCGFGPTDAILAACLLEHAWLFALPPASRLVENMLAYMVSVLLPPMARPAPPEWLFTTYPINSNRVTFRAGRMYYAWAVSAPLIQDPSPRMVRGIKAALPLLGNLRPLLDNMWRGLRYTDYRFHPHENFGARVGDLGLTVWNTCNPDTWLEYDDLFQRLRYTQHLPVLMSL